MQRFGNSGLTGNASSCFAVFRLLLCLLLCLVRELFFYLSEPVSSVAVVVVTVMASTGQESDERTPVSPHCQDACQFILSAEDSRDAPTKSEFDVDVATNNIEDSMFLVKEELVSEEKKVRQENEKRAAEEASQDVSQVMSMTKEGRLKKLLDLLSKSKLYSDYLAQKLKDGSAAQKIKERKALIENNKDDDLTKQNERKQNVHRAAKRKGKADEFECKENFSSQKKRKVDTNSAPRTVNGQTIPEKQPLLVTGVVMRPYQLEGYEWMTMLYENGINGILADEMGLGKTLQTIALFCHLMEMGVPGPYLVVAPLSTVTNWVNEFKRFAPAVPVVLYHGDKKEREMLRKKHINQTTRVDAVQDALKNVFVTSYAIAMNDRPFLRSVKWRFIVVDEGHRLKNMNCKLVKELKLYSTANKLLLTGTPLQNNLAELWSLLNFLMGEIFDDLSVFESWFNVKDMDESGNETSRILQQEQEDQILATLHQILTPFLLRRMKTDVDMKIPPKKEVLVYCPMSSKQREMYEAVVNKTIEEIVGQTEPKEPMEETGRGKRRRTQTNASNASHGLRSAYKTERLTSDVRVSVRNRMMDLRKTTNHPYLVEHPLTEDGMFFEVSQDLIDVSGKMTVLDQLLEALMERGHKILIFSQMTRMLDIIGDYFSFKGFRYSRLDGSMHFTERQENIDSFNNDPDVKLFVLSTRAGGLGINLTAADTAVIFDSDWNPQGDLQAQDRCHRIGQTKPVMIYRLVTAKTFDQKIVERAAAKRKLEKMVIHSKKFKSQEQGLESTMKPLTMQELLDLLHSKDYSGEVGCEDGSMLLKKDVLEKLMDRTALDVGGSAQ